MSISPFGEGDRAGQLARLGPGDVLITSYSLLRQEDKLFSEVKWATAVLDEAQAIKNVAAKRSKAAMALDAGFRHARSGSPREAASEFKRAYLLLCCVLTLARDNARTQARRKPAE